jgi:hypothetical protein
MLIIPHLLLIITLFIATPTANEVRYAYSLIISMPFLLTVILMKRIRMSAPSADRWNDAGIFWISFIITKLHNKGAVTGKLH